MRIERRLLVAALAGALLAAAFPPYHLPYFLPLAMALLLHALDGATPRQGFYLGIVSSGIHLGATLFWLSNLFASAVAPLCAILALFPIAFCTLYPLLNPPSLAGLPLAPSGFAKGVGGCVLWVGLEYFRAELFVLNFGWSTLGYAVAGRPAFAPLAATLGVYGISFLVVLIASLRGWVRWVGMLLWAVACLIRLPAPAPLEPLTVRLVQAFADEEGLYELSVGPHTDLLLWPEYALDTDPRGAKTWERLQAVAQNNQSVFLFGAKDTKTSPDKDQYFNTAFVLGPDGTLLGTHPKNHPVHFVKDGLPGTSAKAIPTPLGRLGVAICFDNDYPDVDRRLAQDDAEVFLVPNMDPAEWGPIQQAQHRLLFAMRAMENGKWLARADVAGGTSVVAPNGVETVRVKNGNPGSLTATVGRVRGQSLYTQLGWVFGPLCLILSLLWGATCLSSAVLASRFFPKRSAQKPPPAKVPRSRGR